MNDWLRAVAEDFPHTWRPLAAIALVLAGAGVGKLLGRLLSLYAERAAAIGRDRTRPLRRWTFGMLLCLCAFQAVLVLEIPERAARLVAGTAFGLGILFTALLAREVLVLSLALYAAQVASRTSAPVDTQFIPLLNKLTTVFIFATAAMFVLRGYGYDISTLLVSLGVGSLALGLAMQQTLANMIAGFTIMLDRPFRIGDRVQLSSGEIGDVMEIGLRSTRILTFDLSTLIIPNAQMVNERLLNLTYPDRRQRPVLTLGVAYGSDLDAVKRIIGDVLAAEPLVDKDPPASIVFTGYGESAVNLSVRFTVADHRLGGDAIDAVGRSIGRRFEEAGIVIPYPVRVILQGSGEGGAGRAARREDEGMRGAVRA